MKPLSQEEIDNLSRVIDKHSLITSKKTRNLIRFGVMLPIIAANFFLFMALNSEGLQVYTYAICCVCHLLISVTLLNAALFIHRLENISRICREESKRLSDYFEAQSHQP